MHRSPTARSAHRSLRCGGDRHPLLGAVRLGRHGRRHPGVAAAMGAVVPGLRQGGHERRLAARGGGIARLHRRPISGRFISDRICPTSPVPSSASARCCPAESSGSRRKRWVTAASRCGGAGSGSEGHGLSAARSSRGGCRSSCSSWWSCVDRPVVAVARGQLAASRGFGGSSITAGATSPPSSISRRTSAARRFSSRGSSWPC